MPSCAGTLVALSLAGLIHAQAVITNAKGDSGNSKGLFVDANNPADANFISQAEIVANIVNECGRTLLAGNIDIGEQTELALLANQVTKVAKGSTVDVTISQRTPEGAGPFTCDLDLTSNGNGINGQTPLQVTQSNANAGTGDLSIQVALPADMACIGGSTGNICTVRCKNAANFGGCFPVQQTDSQPNQNDAATISTAQTLQGVLNQVQQNQKDLPAANSGLAGASLNEQGVKIADALLKVNPNLSNGTAVSTPGAAAPPAATPVTGGNNNDNNGNNNGNNGNNNGNNNNNGNGNGNGRGNRNGNGNGNGNNGNGNGNGNNGNQNNNGNGNNGNQNNGNGNGNQNNNGNGNGNQNNNGNGNNGNRNGAGNNGNGNGNNNNANGNGNGNGNNGNGNNNANGNGNNGNNNNANGNGNGNGNNANRNNGNGNNANGNNGNGNGNGNNANANGRGNRNNNNDDDDNNQKRGDRVSSRRAFKFNA